MKQHNLLVFKWKLYDIIKPHKRAYNEWAIRTDKVFYWNEKERWDICSRCRLASYNSHYISLSVRSLHKKIILLIVCHTFGQKPQHGFVQQILGCTKIEYVLINWMNEKTADILNVIIAKSIISFLINIIRFIMKVQTIWRN